MNSHEMFKSEDFFFFFLEKTKTMKNEMKKCKKCFSKTRNTRKTPNDVQAYGSAVRSIESLT